MFLPTLSFQQVANISQGEVHLPMSANVLQTHTPNGASPTPTPVITSFTAPHWPFVPLTRQELLNSRGKESFAVSSSESGTQEVISNCYGLRVCTHTLTKKIIKSALQRPSSFWVQSPLLGIPFWAGGGASGHLLTIPLPSTRPSRSIEGRTFCTHRILGQGSLLHHL